MLPFKAISEGVRQLFYPHLCCGCGTDIIANENLLCAQCMVQLPVTRYAIYAGNPTEKIFWGRIPLAAAHSEFYFSKTSLIQHLIHQLKYKNNREIGIYLGKLMAYTLINSKRFEQVDALIPLPMFPEKERKRGYNQAAIICHGMSEIMQVPVWNNVLIRQHLTETQTRKHRTERWANVEGSFAHINTHLASGKHLLLVDDVITTGATLEAGGRCLLKNGEVKLSIATLATAVK